MSDSQSIRLPPLTEDEQLGRGVFSSGHAKRSASRAIPPHVFLERDGIDSISVDRMGHAPLQKMTVIGDEIAGARGRNFFGWAVLTVGDATQRGRTVHEEPLTNNPYHAGIHLNIGNICDRRDQQIEHSNELAAKSHWMPRSES